MSTTDLPKKTTTRFSNTWCFQVALQLDERALGSFYDPDQGSSWNPSIVESVENPMENLMEHPMEDLMESNAIHGESIGIHGKSIGNSFFGEFGVCQWQTGQLMNHLWLIIGVWGSIFGRLVQASSLIAKTQANQIIYLQGFGPEMVIVGTPAYWQ